MTDPSARCPGGEVIVYQASDGQVHLNVRLKHDTVWLTLRQMAKLFGRDRSVVSRHVRNVYLEGELDREATCAKFAQVRHEGVMEVTRMISHFNLDMVISVGYRVKSLQATHFRQWAIRILREHLVSGYTLNQRRLADTGLDRTREALGLLARTLRKQALTEDMNRVALDLIADYAETWRLLVEYDEGRLKAPPSARPAGTAFEYPVVVDVITRFKQDLLASGNASPVFGIPRGEMLKGILGSVEQTMFGEPLYQSREEKAANLLYFIVKDHPFVDGNKRIGSLLFLLYAAQEGIAHRLNPQALTLLSLLIAKSMPADKSLMISLIVNLMAESPP